MKTKGMIKVKTYIKMLDKIAEIMTESTNKVYKKDSEMINAKNQIIAMMRTSDLMTAELAKMLLGFYIHCISSKEGRFKDKDNVILTTFYHDLGGTLNADRFFSPRATRYLEFYTPNILK